MEVNVIEQRVMTREALRREGRHASGESKECLILDAIQLHIAHQFKRLMKRAESTAVIFLRDLKISERCIEKQHCMGAQLRPAHKQAFANQLQSMFDLT